MGIGIAIEKTLCSIKHFRASREIENDGTTQLQSVSKIGNIAYATRQDFCRLFLSEMKSLFLLSFTLTASEEDAEECILEAFVGCITGISVVRDFAGAWARRTLMRSAINLQGCRLSEASEISDQMPFDCGQSAITANKPRIAKYHPLFDLVRALSTVERLVFTMTILERLSDEDSASLLRISKRQVRDARLRAVMAIAKANLVSATSLQSAPHPMNHFESHARHISG